MIRKPDKGRRLGLDAGCRFFFVVFFKRNGLFLRKLEGLKPQARLWFCPVLLVCGLFVFSQGLAWAELTSTQTRSWTIALGGMGCRSLEDMFPPLFGEEGLVIKATPATGLRLLQQWPGKAPPQARARLPGSLPPWEMEAPLWLQIPLSFLGGGGQGEDWY